MTRFIRRAGMTALATILMTGACSDGGAAPELARAVSVAKAKWLDQHVTSYTFTASRSCECTREAAGPVRVTVVNGAVTSATLVDTGASVDKTLWFDINGLFTLIESELARLPERLEARYDATRGFPTYVAYGEREVDAGAAITVTDLTPQSALSPD